MTTERFQTVLKIYGFHRNNPGAVHLLAAPATAQEVREAVVRLLYEGYVLTDSQQVCIKY